MKNKIMKLYPGAYRIEDPLDVYMFLVLGSEKALLVDTGYGTVDLKKIVPDLMRSDPIFHPEGVDKEKASSEELEKYLFVMNTHGHIDHNGMDYRYPVVYLDPADTDVFKLHADPVRRRRFVRETLGKWYGIAAKLPVLKGMIETICYTEDAHLEPMPDVFDLGDRKIEAIQTPGHTPGSVCLLDRHFGALFSGDMVCDEGVLLYCDYSCSVETFKASMEKLMDLYRHGAFTRIYPSHHLRELSIEFVQDYIDLADSVLEGKAEAYYQKSAAGEGYIAKYKTIALAYRKLRDF